MFGLDELTAVVPPPATPSITTCDADWLQVYSVYGTRLPGDFIHTCKVYGNGAFCSVTHRWTAGVDLYNHWAFWMKEVPACLWEIRDIRERFPKRVPFPLYWEPGGLLPWGRTSNEGCLCWLTRGSLVDMWPVVVIRPGAGQSQVFEMSAIQFLARAIAGTITCGLLPKGFPGRKGVFFKSFSTGTSSVSGSLAPAQPGTPPNGGPAALPDNLGVTEGPPSVS